MRFAASAGGSRGGLGQRRALPSSIMHAGTDQCDPLVGEGPVSRLCFCVGGLSFDGRRKYLVTRSLFLDNDSWFMTEAEMFGVRHRRGSALGQWVYEPHRVDPPACSPLAANGPLLCGANPTLNLTQLKHTRAVINSDNTTRKHEGCLSPLATAVGARPLL